MKAGSATCGWLALQMVLAGCVNARSAEERRGCEKEAAYENDIRATESLVVSREIQRIPVGLLGPGIRYACAIVSFDISADGKASSPKVLDVYPSRAMSDSAKATLAAVEFRGGQERQGVLMFEASIED